MKIYDLPIELWRRIFAHLSERDKIHMVVASKFFQGAVNMAQIEAAKARSFCEGCNMVPYTGVYADHKCIDCYDGDSCITLEHARNLFRMNAVEVGKLPCQQPKRSRNGSLKPESLYRFKVVREAAVQKHGKRMSEVVRDLDAAERQKRVAKDALEAKRTTKLLCGLEKLGVQYSAKFDHLVGEYLSKGKDLKGTLARVQDYIRYDRERAARTVAIDARLDALGIDTSYYADLREKYLKGFAGHRNLDRVVQIIADTWALERSDATVQQKLERAMAIRGLELSVEVPRWEQYVAGPYPPSLPRIVEPAFEAHMLHRHTCYDSYCDSALTIADARRRIADFSGYAYELRIRVFASLNALSDEDAGREPLCPCGFSRKTVDSDAALDYLDSLAAKVPPSREFESSIFSLLD